MILKKRQLLMATLVIALGAAIFVNWYYTRPEAEQVGSTGVSGPMLTEQSGEPRENLGDAQYVNAIEPEAEEVAKREYFASAKLRRATAHDEAKETLQEVIGNTKSPSEAAKSANEALAALAHGIKLEGDMENLITARLGSECVVILNGDSAEVVVGKGVLNEQLVMQIQEIVMKQTALSAERVTIVELKK